MTSLFVACFTMPVKYNHGADNLHSDCDCGANMEGETTDQHKNALSRSINQLVEPFLRTVIMKNIFLQARQKNEDA